MARWVKAFREGRDAVQDDLRTERPNSSTYCLPVGYIRMNIIFTAHCVGCTFFGLGEPGCFHSFDWRFKFGSYGRAQVSSIATIRLRTSPLSIWYRSKKARTALKFHGVSNAVEQWHLYAAARAFLDRYQRESGEFLGQIVAIDETWARSYEPNECKHSATPSPKKVRRTQCDVKV